MAPDYILADETIAENLIQALIEQINASYSPNSRPIETSEDYGRIVNAKHFSRIKDLLEDAVEKGAEIAFGGNMNEASNYIEPTLLKKVTLNSGVLHEEIFGPVLPILSYRTIDEAIEYINKLPKPLALYAFGGTRVEKERILTETSSGAAVLNDCAVHFVQNNLPFGGVNNSGIGKSHGHFGFLTFSNEKAIMKQKHGFTSTGLFFPPYTPIVKKAMDWFIKFF